MKFTMKLAGRVGVIAGIRGVAVFLLSFWAVYGQEAVEKERGEGPGAYQYEYRETRHPDGIGKLFLGREIAHVMGHQGAQWLERAEREEEERPDLVVRHLKLQPGDRVADIGAGTGYFCRRMAPLVGPSGAVYAVDIQPEMLEYLSKKMAERKITNVKPVLGTITDPKLPEGGIDLVLMVDVYHEFSHPYEMLRAICAALKPGGRVAFVEFKAEDPNVPIKALHKMSEAQVRKEAELHPLEWVETVRSLPWQHLIIFRKTEEGAGKKKG